LPTWLSPVQARVITVSESNIPYAQSLVQKLREDGIRVDIDYRNEKIGYKIREFNSRKINYALIVGDKEAAENTVSVRTRGEQESPSMNSDEFLRLVKEA